MPRWLICSPGGVCLPVHSLLPAILLASFLERKRICAATLPCGATCTPTSVQCCRHAALIVQDAGPMSPVCSFWGVPRKRSKRSVVVTARTRSWCAVRAAFHGCFCCVREHSVSVGHWMRLQGAIRLLIWISIVDEIQRVVRGAHER